MGGVVNRVTGLAVAAALLTCPTMAVGAGPAGATAGPAPLNPMIALSIFGSQASASALCGSAAASAAQAPGAGCVLPVLDPPPPVVQPPAPAPAVPVAAAPAGIGVTPILFGLLGIAGLTALLLSQDDDDNDDPAPVSPA